MRNLYGFSFSNIVIIQTELVNMLSFTQGRSSLKNIIES